MENPRDLALKEEKEEGDEEETVAALKTKWLFFTAEGRHMCKESENWAQESRVPETKRSKCQSRQKHTMHKNVTTSI